MEFYKHKILCFNFLARTCTPRNTCPHKKNLPGFQNAFPFIEFFCQLLNSLFCGESFASEQKVAFAAGFMIHRRQQKQKKINTAAKNCVCATFDFQSSFLSETILLNQVFLFRNIGMGDHLRTPCAAAVRALKLLKGELTVSICLPLEKPFQVDYLQRTPLYTSGEQKYFTHIFLILCV